MPTVRAALMWSMPETWSYSWRSISMSMRRYGTFPFAAGDPQQGIQQVIKQQGVLVSENFSRRYGIGVGDHLSWTRPRAARPLPWRGWSSTIPPIVAPSHGSQHLYGILG